MSTTSAQRGTSVAELLSVIAIMALIMSSVALIIGPLLHSQDHTQAKTDTVQAAAMALYRMERDLRNSSVDQIFVCTTGATPSCSLPPTAVTVTQAIVAASAFKGGTGGFQLQPNNYPSWQGATVYWVDALGNLDVAFDPAPGTFTAPGPLNLSEAQTAVSDVTAAGGMQIARFIQTLSLGVPAGSEHEVTLQLEAQSTVNGAANETTYRTNVETRNRSS